MSPVETPAPLRWSICLLCTALYVASGCAADERPTTPPIDCDDGESYLCVDDDCVCGSICETDGDCHAAQVCVEGDVDPMCVDDQFAEDFNLVEPDSQLVEINENRQLDLLWTIDNSGSMCRSQEILREGIDDFVDVLEDGNIDFHIAVTTTQFVDHDAYPFETVAKPAHLQSTPQPVPGFEDECLHPVYTWEDVDEGVVEPGQIGEPNYEHIDPIVDALEQAVECTENPDEWQHLLDDFNEDEMRCALVTSTTCSEEHGHDQETDYCTCPAGEHGFDNCIDCDQFDTDRVEEFFPAPEAYRDIPLVLRSEDYELEDGTLDTDSLRDDFSCMSFVGTRGHGFQQGLNAAVEALSPEMTGAADVDPHELMENPEAFRDDYPNAGFVRPDAETGVIFVSDNNDCSHDGDLDMQSRCSVHECTIQEAKGEDGHLIDTADLAEQFKLNVAASRGMDVDPVDESLQEVFDDEAERQQFVETILPVSIHGRYQGLSELEQRLEEQYDDDSGVPEQCPDEEAGWVGDTHRRTNANWAVPPSCRDELGMAWSGHRYEYFLREFEQFFPRPDDNEPDEPLPGQICEDFTPVIDEMAEFFGSEVATGCIEGIPECDGAEDSCPDGRIDGRSGECVSPADADDAPRFCDTTVDVWLAPANDRDQGHLALTDYCVEDTFGESRLADGCLVDPDKYQFVRCDEDDGLALQWLEDDWESQIGEFRTFVDVHPAP